MAKTRKARPTDYEPEFNPFSFLTIFESLRAVALAVKELGLLPVLEKAAAKTETHVDDTAVRIAIAIVNVVTGGGSEDAVPKIK